MRRSPARSRSASSSLMSQLKYSVLVEPLPTFEGCGFIAIVPDLPGCMSDGDTAEEAISNVQDAILSWIEAAAEMKRAIPQPTSWLSRAGCL